MSGQILSRRRQLSTKQWSGNKCSQIENRFWLETVGFGSVFTTVLVSTKIQLPSYAMDHRDWPGKQWRAECQARRCTRLTSVPFANSQAFLKAYFIFILFLNVSFHFQIVHCYVDKTESLSTCHIFSKLLFCRQFCWQSACRWQDFMIVLSFILKLVVCVMIIHPIVSHLSGMCCRFCCQNSWYNVIGQW